MARRVLLIRDDADAAALLSEALAAGGDTLVAQVGTEGLERIPAGLVDLVIVAVRRVRGPLIDAIGALQGRHPVPLVVFAREGDEETAARVTRAGASAFVVDGLRRERLAPILTAAEQRFEEGQRLRAALRESEARLRERKLVERAKGLLMKRRGLDEESAYRALRKLAMDRNRRLADIAAGIIDSEALMR